MTRRSCLLVVLAIVLAACSSTSDSAGSEQAAPTSAIEEQTATSTPPASSESETLQPATTEPDAVAEDTGSTGVAAAPAVPNSEFDEVTSTSSGTSAWISRRSMDEERIELVWTAEAGANSYEVHRLPATDARPDANQMTEDNRIHSGEQNGTFIDDEVEAGDRYWYGIRSIDADGALTSTGWHRADAVSDDQPPSAVDLSFIIDDGAVNLSWDAPEENYELHSYRVLRAVDGAELEPVVTTWNLDQTSFVDAEPPTGSVTYAVEAADFHWNRSDQAIVTVEVAG